MPTIKAKAKSKTTTAHTKAKTKAKAKSKTQTKTKAKTTAKTKTKTKIKAKPSQKTKSKVTAKPKVKTKATVKDKTKQKAKVKIKAETSQFNDNQKESLLTWIEKIVNLRKGKRGGLKSFSKIDGILNKYNQHYTESDEKFDAIVKFGMEKDPRVTHEHFYVNIEGREKEVDDLYVLLAQIFKGKVDFNEAKEKIESIYAISSTK